MKVINGTIVKDFSACSGAVDTIEGPVEKDLGSQFDQTIEEN